MLAGDVPDRLIFGNFLLRKSVTNLEGNPAVGILVMTTELEGWVLQGEFLGWQQTGAYVDRLNSTDLLRYNPYTGIRNAGILGVRALVRQFRISRLRVVADYLVARVARFRASGEGATALPPVVRERFSQLTAVRVLAAADGEGTPLVVPALSLQPAGANRLVCAEGPAADVLQPLPAGTPVAANLLTLDVVSFQVKGHWLGSRHVLGAPVGDLAVTAVYAGGPPIPGRRVA
jgi:hypothetical protein